MSKTKRVLSFVTSFTIAASAFSAFVIQANAEETLSATYVKSASGQNDTKNLIVNKDASSTTPVTFNSNTGTWKGVAVLEFSVPAVDAERITDVTLNVSLHNTGTRGGSRTYQIYKSNGVEIGDSLTDYNSVLSVLGDTLYTGEALVDGGYRNDSISDNDALTQYVKDSVSADGETTIQFAFSNAAQMFEVLLAPDSNLAESAAPSLTLTLADEGSVSKKVTIQYQDDEGHIFKTEEDEAFTNTEYTPQYDNIIYDYENGNKYTYVSGGDPVQITDDTTITLVYSKEAIGEYVVNVKADGDIEKDLNTFTGKEAQNVSYYFPQYIVDGSTAYETAANGSGAYYGGTVSAIADNAEITKTYTKAYDNVVLYEDLDDSEDDNASVRASNCSAYVNKEYASESEIKPGTYTFVLRLQDRGRGSTITVNDKEIYNFNGTNKNSWQTVTISDVKIETSGQLKLNAGSGGTYDDLDTILVYGVEDQTTEPTATPTATAAPTDAPTATPTATAAPTDAPTATPTATAAPTDAPTATPTATAAPSTEAPTAAPTSTPIVVEKEGVVFNIAAPETATKAVAVKAVYDENKNLESVTFEDVNIEAGQTEVEVAAAEGTKVMLWDSLENMKPLADAKIAEKYTVTETPATETPSTEAPTDAPTDAPSTEPIETEVYLDENFDSYTAQTIITSADNTVSDPPAPVTLGNIIYAAGRRNNGPINTYASISDAKALNITSDQYSTSGRGVSFSFADTAGIPDISVLGTDQILEMSMDILATQGFTVTDLGDITTEDLTTTTETVHLRVILDPTADMQYVIVEKTDGTLLSSRAAALADNVTTFKGMSFYLGSGTFTIDNLKVESKNKDVAEATFTVKNNGEPLADAQVTVGNITVTTNEEGIATAVLPNGEYTVTASKNGYEHTSGAGDNDSTTIIVNGDSVSYEFSLAPRDYVQTPEEVIVGGGQDFISAPKDSEYAQSAPFTVVVKDIYGIEIPSDGYKLEWNIYPAGTTTADPNVTIENGVVSVSKDFNVSEKIAAYDVTVAAFTDDRNNKVTKTIYIANNDIIYYEPLNFNQPGGTGNRGASQNFVNSVEIPDIMSVSMDVNFTNGTDGQSTIFINSDAGELVGLQLTSDNNIAAWTGWTGNSAYNQYDDAGSYTNGETLISGYEKNTPFTVTFVIDKSTKNITVSSGATTLALPYTIDATSITGIQFGQYRNYGAVTVDSLLVQEPDNNYLSIVGDLDFAKVSGSTIEKQYQLGQSVIVPDETFNWSISPAEQGVTIDNEGKISVADTAIAGKYTLTATSSINPEKTDSVEITVGDFQQVNDVVIEGPRAYASVGVEGTYEITHAVDSFGDEISALLNNVTWTSSDTEVANIDSATGKLNTLKEGTTEITATITNGTAVTEVKFNVTVATYSLTGDATGNSTTVDTSALVKGENIAAYLVTTADASGNEVSSKEVAASEITGGSYNVDTTGATKYEIAPIYTFDAGSPATYGSYTGAYSVSVPADTYNFEVTVTGGRCDVYANDQLLVNNILQGGSAWNTLPVNDIVVNEGYINITTADYGNGATSANSSVKFTLVKSPSIVNRTQKVYVLGDSLVCIYYNGGSSANNAQTGWGQVLQNYVKGAEVVDLGNSGVTANGLYGTAFTQVLTSAKPGDIMVLESGYNDRTYDTEEIMTNAVTSMVNEAKEKGVNVILVSPNASQHDYSGSVVWTRVMEAVATATATDYIDLAQESYDFLYANYGDEFYNEDKTLTTYSKVYNVSDLLHSTYNGAQKWASIVAQGMYDLGYDDIINTEYSYTFKDGKNQDITCNVTAE